VKVAILNRYRTVPWPLSICPKCMLF
jgi:hypothetical protein